MHTKRSLGRKTPVVHQLLYFTPAVVWGIFIIYFSVLPGPEVPRLLHDVNDKLMHGIIYFLSAGLIYLAFIRYNLGNSISRASLAITLAVCISFGAAIELVQHYLVLQRSGDWMDFVANSIGAVVSVLLLSLIHRAVA